MSLANRLSEHNMEDFNHPEVTGSEDGSDEHLQEINEVACQCQVLNMPLKASGQQH